MKNGDEEGYTGQCFRHQARFKPSEQFDNNCPACYWEMKHQKAEKQKEQVSGGIDDGDSVAVAPV